MEPKSHPKAGAASPKGGRIMPDFGRMFREALTVDELTRTTNMTLLKVSLNEKGYNTANMTLVKVSLNGVYYLYMCLCVSR